MTFEPEEVRFGLRIFRLLAIVQDTDPERGGLGWLIFRTKVLRLVVECSAHVQYLDH